MSAKHAASDEKKGIHMVQLDGLVLPQLPLYFFTSHLLLGAFYLILIHLFLYHRYY
jgi:hypothetical protein